MDALVQFKPLDSDSVKHSHVMTSKILIVDDRPVDRDYYRTVLGYVGYDILEASNGAEALEMVRTHRPDLVLTDVMMPTLDGYALMQAIRADAQIAVTKVIFCTANYREHEAKQLAAAIGASRFLVKPLEPQVLLSAVREVLERETVGVTEIKPAEVERAHLQLLNDKLMARTAELEAEISARQRIEQDLQEQRNRLEALVAERTAKLEAANLELQSFTFAASHDLRSPLGRIRSFASMLEKGYRDRLDADGLQLLNFILQNAERMTTLVDDLLDHAHIEQKILDRQLIDVRVIVQGLLHDRAEDIRQIGAVVSLDLPPITLQTNAHGLSQVLRNLIENAIKYSAQVEEPAIEIGGRMVGETCRLWVKDNGIGFDMAYHEKIFEIFQRLHSYHDYPGSGVGLALVKRAMERMGGRVWAESVPGKGATFFLEI